VREDSASRYGTALDFAKDWWVAMDNAAIANLLEKLANYVEVNEAEKVAATTQERQTAVDAVCGKYAEATGEELDSDVRQKLATTDVGLINMIEKLAAPSLPDELGSPSDRRSQTAPLTSKEASAGAGERFLDWILS
jgi:hypothetical protein